MKKALSLILALVLCLALAIPALAVNQAYYPGDASPNAAPGETRVTVPADEQGVNPVILTDANLALIPSVDPTAPDYYYEVMPRDTLAAIAFAFYGNSNAATALYNANKNGHFLVTGGILEAYRALRIPPVLENGTYKRLDTVGQAFYPVTIASIRITNNIAYDLFGAHYWINDYQALNAPARLNQIVYIVQKGDTLATLAKAFYNNNSAVIVNAIKAANVGRITGDTITAGQYIILPVITIGY